MKKFSALTFDLWDTLIKEVPRSRHSTSSLRIERIGSFLASRGIPAEPDALEDGYRKSGEFLELMWSKELDAPLEDHLMLMLRSVDPKIADRLSDEDLVEVSRIYSEILLSRRPILMPGAKEVLDSLDSAGYRIGLVCNTGRTPGSVLRKLLEEFRILAHFDFTAFSDEMLVRKPSPVLFSSVLDKLGVVPRAAVHIGDNPDADIAGAKGAGMAAIQVDTGDVGRSELADGYVTSLEQLRECIRELEAKL